MKQRLIILSLSFVLVFQFLAINARAQIQTTWFPFKPQLPKTPLQYPVDLLTTRQFNFTAISSGLEIKPITKEEVTYHRLSTPGGRLFGDIGKPGLPGFTRLVAVPKGAQIEIEIDEGPAEVFTGYQIYPVQAQLEDNKEFQPGPFIIDENFYQTDQFHPESLVSIEYDWVRGCQVALVHVHTARYNPVEGTLHCYPELDLNIEFVGGDDTDIFVPMEKRSIFLEESYGQILANYSIVQASIADLIYEGLIVARCDLLIITPAAFETQADELAEWKRERGFFTRVVTLDAIDAAQGGTSADDIRAYIKDVYDTSNLSYVLLLGDAEDIPPHYVTPHPTSHGNTMMGTDLYYAEMDYAGYLPDLAIGRISVDTAAEAQIVVDKIIAYEQDPPDVDDFYETILHAGFFQDDDRDGVPEPSDIDGRAEREFVQTLEEIRHFFGVEGYSHLPRQYTTDSPNPQQYRDGTDIPADLDVYPWNGSAVGIINEIESGSFLVVHRDHGSRDGWGDPEFEINNLAPLDNGNLLPVTLSINCQSGWFDNETDDWRLNTAPDSESFAEEFLRMEGGSVAVIAATRNSPSWPNDALTKAFIDCIWNDMIPGYPTAGDTGAAEVVGSHRLGDALNYAKFYVATQWDTVSACQRPFEIYHCLGDPTMEIWTASPHPTFDFPPYDPIIPNEFVYWFPLVQDGAIASLLQEGEIISQGISIDGWVMFQLDEPLPYSDDTSISFTKTGYVTQIVPLSVMAIPAVMDIDPDTLNLQSKGKYITCYIELPEGYDVGDIDITTVLLSVGTGTISAEASPTYLGDYNNNGIPDLMVKFHRGAVQDICSPGTVEMVVEFEAYAGTKFGATDTVLVIDKGREH